MTRTREQANERISHAMGLTGIYSFFTDPAAADELLSWALREHFNPQFVRQMQPPEREVLCFVRNGNFHAYGKDWKEALCWAVDAALVSPDGFVPTVEHGPVHVEDEDSALEGGE